MMINDKQLMMLESFKLHTWNVFHNNAKNMFKFYAEELDKLGISWSLQNKIANWCSIRENGFKSLKEFLKNEGIELKQFIEQLKSNYFIKLLKQFKQLKLKGLK